MRAPAGDAAQQVLDAIDILLDVQSAASFTETSLMQQYWRDANTAACHAGLNSMVGYEVFGKTLRGSASASARWCRRNPSVDRWPRQRCPDGVEIQMPGVSFHRRRHSGVIHASTVPVQRAGIWSCHGAARTVLAAGSGCSPRTNPHRVGIGAQELPCLPTWSGWRSGLFGGVPARVLCPLRGPAGRRLIVSPNPRLPIAAAAA